MPNIHVTRGTRRARQPWQLAAVVAGLVLMLALAACGSRGTLTPPPTDPGAPAVVGIDLAPTPYACAQGKRER